nr:restriction endonuclease [Vibrio anguillarum]
MLVYPSYCLIWRIARANFIFNAIGPNLPKMAPYFAFLFLIPAPIAFFKQYQRKHNYLATTSQIRANKNTTPFNSLSWIEFESYIGEYFKQQGYDVKQIFLKDSWMVVLLFG